MIKLRISGGFLNSDQARVIGECAKEYGQDYIDLTTRQQCEIRYLKIEDMPQLLERLKVVGIDAYQTGVDNIRSIMCDPLDDMSFDNVLASHKTLLKLQEKFLYSPEWISTLPRKFNTAISGSLSNRCNVYCHDASFILAQKDGCYGYNMYLGGKVGVVGKNADIFLANEDEVIKAFESITDIFRRFGFRDNRNKNRLHFLIEAVGTEHCPFGVIENKNDAINMSTYLDEKVPLESGRVRMYWSACVKGCGIHGLGDIGFEGCKTKVNGENEGGVHIYLGGKLTSEGVEGRTVLKSAPLRYAQFYVESLMLEYKKHRDKNENFEKFSDRVLTQYTNANIGFFMKLGAYLRDKNIDVEFGLSKKVNIGKNEEFEVFELGRKLYYALSKKEPYSSYDRFTNTLKNEKLENIRDLVPNIDENIAQMLDNILNTKEEKRAVVFSELIPFIELY